MKTKGQKSAPNELLKTNNSPCFQDELLKGKEFLEILNYEF